MKIGLIGRGAIAGFTRNEAEKRGHSIEVTLLRPDRAAAGSDGPCGRTINTVDAFPDDLDLVIDCAGHTALATYGVDVLARGFDLMTVSLGALADPVLHDALVTAAQRGGARLHLASGAIGALDCLQAARVGPLHAVTYVGRKPPQGWRGSPAEAQVDLDTLTNGAVTHFTGTAREAALAYPKNANVTAAVALAGIGFDDTRVVLIADAEVSRNIHRIEATGDFGDLRFEISGNALPDNPRSSALAAMSVISKIEQLCQSVVI
ncbi:aspartate dehydrogenase [Tritonibacter horizontis]|uniref:L-aspartate dehydrogenase n=1 Tax=Tritonibacter horizontis TaxID=1768241 RepID=A0A132C1U5_9RHOB|nr:aspartate dehydrogenase [Tritonibacter horizontis]KUP94544.1 L-aspartate dehydrogenase [Tritonibacter horizontis]